jgi:hypothetical protein
MAPPTLAPILPPESNDWTERYIRPLFRVMYTDTLAEVRGVGVAMDLDPMLTDARRYAEQRDAVAGNVYYQGNRGHQSRIPTPQELIRRVTGVGDVSRGK